MKNKKKSIITLVAVLTAIVGIAVAVGAFLKRKAGDLGEKLDYDGSLYYEDDDPEDVGAEGEPSVPEPEENPQHDEDFFGDEELPE